MTAYRTAFNELVKEGYLIATDKKDDYIFYDKSQTEEAPKKDDITVHIPEEKVEEINGFIF